MTITLPPELENSLTARAIRQGTTPELLALHDLHRLYEPLTEDAEFAGKTLADVLRGLTGTIRSSEHTGEAVSYLSEAKGDDFAEHLAEKRRQGKL